jgi:uncharacterized protein YigE (DUF2233 family)
LFLSATFAMFINQKSHHQPVQKKKSHHQRGARKFYANQNHLCITKLNSYIRKWSTNSYATQTTILIMAEGATAANASTR